MRTHTNQDGITLLITLLLMGVLLGVSASLLNVTLKQYQLSGVSYQSEIAFQAADAGMECASYHVAKGNLDVESYDVDGTPPKTIACFGESDTDSIVDSGDEQYFEFTWGSNPEKCTKVSVWQYYKDGVYGNPIDDLSYVSPIDGASSETCPAATRCTYIRSKGYNVGCGAISGGTRVVERVYVSEPGD